MSRKQKSTVEPYLVIPRRTLRSKELNGLSIHARWLYIILCSEWTRKGPNKFILTYNQLSEITGLERHRISACLKELVAGNFITKENHGGLMRNPNTYSMKEDWLYLKDINGIDGNNN